eukprot:m.487531 g.487531  ORF g.487531 m.487531 type:complete len:107 (-) comp25095_c0_seq1:24-344(-)
MPLHHIVLFKFKAECTAEQLGAIDEGLHGLASLAQVTSLSYGPAEDNVYDGYTNRSQGFTHALHVVVADGEALSAYNSCDEHQAVVKLILPAVQEGGVLAVDYNDK